MKALNATTSLRNKDKTEFVEALQTVLKIDIASVIEQVRSLEDILSQCAHNFIESVKIPAIVAIHQQLINVCLDCYIINLAQARESLNKRVGSLPMPPLDKELELAKKVRDTYKK